MSREPDHQSLPLTPAEVKARLLEVSRQIRELEREREALDEVARGLEREEAVVSERRRQVGEEQELGQRRLVALEERLAAVERERVEILEAMPLLERRSEENGERAARLAEQIAEAEAAIRSSSGELSAGGAAMRLLEDSIQRIDHKLLVREQKEVPMMPMPRDPGATGGRR